MDQVSTPFIAGGIPFTKGAGDHANGYGIGQGDVVLIGRKSKVDSRTLMDNLAAGKKPQIIAAEIGCSYSTLRRRLSRHVRGAGFTTLEQAVANHIADKIKASLPLALQPRVDWLLRRK